MAQDKPQDIDFSAVQHRLQEEELVHGSVNATMDIILEGDWLVRFPDPGGRTDPLYIACIVRECSAIRAAFPNNKDRWRDYRHFVKCYAEHAKRVKHTDYVPLSNPPPITSLSCVLIESQRRSQDDRVYTVVNGHTQPQPLQHPVPSASPSARRGVAATTEDDIKELDALAAQYNGAVPSASASTSPPPSPAATSAASMKDDNPYVDEPPTKAVANRAPHVAATVQLPIVSTGKDLGVLGDKKLHLLYANDDEAAIRVLPGGQFYTICGSWLSKRYDTEWKTSRKHAKTKSKQFIGLLQRQEYKVGQRAHASSFVELR